jgi:hypothetical protein
LREEGDEVDTSAFPRSAFANWREGHHWQIDLWRISAWVGLAADRWMVGAVFNTESLTVGIGIGPLYFGAGAIKG